MFGWLKRQQTYFLGYMVQKEDGSLSIHHAMVKMNRKDAYDSTETIVKKLGDKHDCSSERIVIHSLQRM